MSDDVEVEATTAKKGLSPLVAALIGVLSLVIGYGAGAFTGGPVLAMLGLAEEASVEELAVTEPVEDAGVKAADLFQPMDGVFDPEKKRFYA